MDRRVEICNASKASAKTADYSYSRLSKDENSHDLVFVPIPPKSYTIRHVRTNTKL